jgi:predicted DNA-binding WGR domain protein
MLKLYRKTKNRSFYWEAWNDESHLTVHWGSVGDRGEFRQLALERDTEIGSLIEKEARSWRGKGYKEINRDELHRVVIEYKVRGHGSTDDHDKRVSVENLMNECLGWTALGHCDGGDIGSGTMSIFCFVVDAEKAKELIVKELKSHQLLDGAVIAQTVRDSTKVPGVKAPVVRSTTRIVWPIDYARDTSTKGQPKAKKEPDTSISLGAIYGLNVPNATRGEIDHLRQLIHRYCTRTYFNQNNGVSLRIVTEDDSKGLDRSGVHNLERWEDGAGADIYVRRRDWGKKLDAYRKFLWKNVAGAIWTCVDILKAEKITIHRQKLKADLGEVEQEFFADMTELKSPDPGASPLRKLREQFASGKKTLQ